MFRGTRNLICKVTLEYAIWMARKIKDTMIPPEIEKVQIEKELLEVPSKLEIVRQEFEAENERMRKESQRL